MPRPHTTRPPLTCPDAASQHLAVALAAVLVHLDRLAVALAAGLPAAAVHHAGLAHRVARPVILGIHLEAALLDAGAMAGATTILGATARELGPAAPAAAATACNMPYTNVRGVRGQAASDGCGDTTGLGRGLRPHSCCVGLQVGKLACTYQQGCSSRAQD